MKNFPGVVSALIIGWIVIGFTTPQSINDFESSLSHRDTQYVCLPCGGDCDNAVYTKPGTCLHCMMKLVDKASIKFNSIEPDAVCAFIKDMGEKNVVLLDVRSPAEFNGKDKD